MKPVHERLKQIVSDRGLTIHGFAIKYGFNVSTISDIMQGRSNPKIDTLKKISECLEISMAELLCEPEEIEMVKCKRTACQEMCERICNYDEVTRNRILGYMDCLSDNNKYL